MKTHDLAKALTQLGKVLRALPNQDVDDLGANFGGQQRATSAAEGINLSALAALSKYNRVDWERVVREFELPVELRPRDGARDIMGKILAYLADNSSERERIARKSSLSSGEPSELSSALKFLLSND